MKLSKMAAFACLLYLTSYDYTMYVAVRNYKEPCRVNVLYEKYGGGYYDNDTLPLKGIGNPGFASSLVRKNTSDSTYNFIAPLESEVALRPRAFGVPIRKIEIVNESKGSWTVNLLDKKGFKQAKNAGQIKTKGFLFTSSIFIENK